MISRYKRPDKKNALSILESAENDISFALSLPVTNASGATIVRTIHECFRKLGDSLMVADGNISIDHTDCIKRLEELKVDTSRPIRLLDNLRRMRININYYGYKPEVAEVKDVINISKALFPPLSKEVKKIINK